MSERTEEGMRDDGLAVLAYIAAHDGERHPYPEMARELGISYQQVNRAVAALIMQGRVTKTRKGNGWAYSISPR
jgi:DNA-binding IclR family transcriptional regulator